MVTRDRSLHLLTPNVAQSCIEASLRLVPFQLMPICSNIVGGARRDRTDDLLLANLRSAKLVGRRTKQTVARLALDGGLLRFRERHTSPVWYPIVVPTAKGRVNWIARRGHVLQWPPEFSPDGR
jgi:hypothetical protein